MRQFSLTVLLSTSLQPAIGQGEGIQRVNLLVLPFAAAVSFQSNCHPLSPSFNFSPFSSFFPIQIPLYSLPELNQADFRSVPFL